MAPNDWIGGPLALEAFLHHHAWHAKCPKDSGHKYCLELNTQSAGVYGIAFELNTVLHHQWRYDTNWVKKLRDFDLLSYYNKRKLCESALQSLGYDPKRLPHTADPGYGHSQLDSSGDADDKAYDAQINALMDGALPPSLGAPPSSSGATSTGLRGAFGLPCSAAPPCAKAMPRTLTSVTRPCPTSTQGGQVNKMRKVKDVMEMRKKKEKEQTSAKSSVTMSRHMPSPDSDSFSSYQALRKKDDEDYARLVEERKADEEGFEGYWESRYGDID